MSEAPRRKVGRYERILTEHVCDKLWQLDITLAEFRLSLMSTPKSSRPQLSAWASSRNW